jgi:hypothetical protein
MVIGGLYGTVFFDSILARCAEVILGTENPEEFPNTMANFRLKIQDGGSDQILRDFKHTVEYESRVIKFERVPYQKNYELRKPYDLDRISIEP